ncbi:MAG: hypothetical protein LBG50_00205, partial [Clostridiales Family XIII bacterium]|nr:hypothetical protein [Clostridiales Family XIII bacterium]
MNTTHQVNKTKWRGKSAAIVTAAAMLLALFPHGGTAYAADAYTPYGDAYAVQAEGATGSGDPWYYDVYGKGSRTLPASSADLFKKALESEQRTGAGAFPSYPYSYGSDRPLASYWHNLSKAVSMSKYRGDADPLRILKDNASDLKPRTYYYAPFNNSVAVTQADSVKAAAESIKNLTVDYNNGVTTASVPQSLLDNNTNQPVFYKTQRVYVANLDEAYIVSVGIQASMEKMGHLPGRTYTNIANTINTHVYLSTIFYDFKLGYLNSAGQTPTAREGNSGYSFTTDGSGDTYMSLLTNDSAQSVSRTETLESSDTISVSSSVESTKNYSISSERTIGAKVSVGQDIPVIGTKFSAEVSTEFKNSESYSTANTLGNTQGQGKTLNHSSSATVTLPPYTEQMVKQSTENLLLNVAYDYPVHISYKVMTIYSSAQAEGNENEKYEITGRFGDVNYPDAVSNLKARLAQQGNSSVYSDGISVDWSNVTSSSNVLSSTHSPTYPVGTNFINGSMSVGNHAVFCQYRPMSVAGGKLSVGSKGKSTVLKEILSIYPLSEVRADANEYRLKTGEYKWVSDIGVEGYSTKGAPYYGFDKNYGHWSLVGADGTPDSADSAIATLMADSVSNKFKLTAGE